ncbi:MAG: hypothetical protein LBV07_00155 [Syntrophobacterales bacterium]|nr:hypothetical protein [Syntrophobacterales bacterium]
MKVFDLRKKRTAIGNVTALVFVLMFVFACSSYINVAYNKKIFEQGNKAYVVVGAKNNHPPVNDRRTVYSYMYFKNKQNEEIILKVSGVQSFMIPPGEYTLTSFKLGDYIDGSSLATWVDIKDRIEGNFFVSAGEAIYLGEVNTLVTKNVKRAIIGKNYPDSEVEFTTSIANNFENIERRKFETECGKSLIPRIMTWNKLR